MMKYTNATLGCLFSSTRFFDVPAGSPVAGGKLAAVQGEGKGRPEEGSHIGLAGGRFNKPPNPHGRLVLGDHRMRESLRQSLAGLQKLGPVIRTFHMASATPPSGCGNSEWVDHTFPGQGRGEQPTSAGVQLLYQLITSS